MQVIPGGANAKPFVTHHNALDRDLYLRVAQELYIKRCMVGGFERVYELNRNFRNEGLSTQHNPEFTMLEYNEAYLDYIDYMDLTEEMLRTVARNVNGTTKIEHEGHSIDLAQPFERLSMGEAVLMYNATLSSADLKDKKTLANILVTHGVELDSDLSVGQMLMALFEETVEDHLIQPTYITGYPEVVSPLSRRNDDDSSLTDRFELFITGREMANGFSELNDAEDQAKRFERQAAAKSSGDEEAMFFDQDYITALEYGLPPNAGGGLGVDRFVMLLTGCSSIRDVLLFPHLRSDNNN
jgi:lysyl-tRNA synthetase class 2